MPRLIAVGMLLVFSPAVLCLGEDNAAHTPRIIELTADKDSCYRLGNKVAPTLEALPGEPLILRITATRAKQIARDGSVHGLALLDKNLDSVPGWRFYLHPGVQDLAVTAPTRIGRYTAVCTIICSDGHTGMKFTLIVVDPKKVARSDS
jgi:hypothetical protein